MSTEADTCLTLITQRAGCADAGQRADIIHQLAERGIDFQQVAAQAGKPDASATIRCP